MGGTRRDFKFFPLRDSLFNSEPLRSNPTFGTHSHIRGSQTTGELSALLRSASAFMSLTLCHKKENPAARLGLLGIVGKCFCRRLLRRLLLDVVHDIADGLELLGVLVGHFHSEFLLEGHDEFDGVE